MIDSIIETFKAWADFFKFSEADCIESRKPLQGTPYYDYIMIADRGLNSYRVTLEEFTDSKHIDTRLVFKAIGLTASEAIDLVHAFDHISGTADHESSAYDLKFKPEIVDYRASKYVNIRDFNEMLDEIDALNDNQLAYSQRQRLKAAGIQP